MGQMHRRNLLLGAAALVGLAGCSQWQVDYQTGLDPALTRTWLLDDVIVTAPDDLRVNENNTYAPSGDIVWHGEPYGDRRAQVAKIVEEGIRAGASDLGGAIPVVIVARVEQFHAVTPAAVARAPSAVHNIDYVIQVLDARDAQPLTAQQNIEADLEAYTGNAAIAAAVSGQSQRVRIVDHIARVTRGWLGFGPDQRRSFTSMGR